MVIPLYVFSYGIHARNGIGASDGFNCPSAPSPTLTEGVDPFTKDSNASVNQIIPI